MKRIKEEQRVVEQMIVRPEKDGKFTRTKYGLPSRVARPGYPESYARKLIKDTGDKFVQPE